MRARFTSLVSAIALLGGAACVPDVEDGDTLVAEPRVLAIQASPAEAKPRGAIKLTALYADSDGELKSATLDWGLCANRKSLAELGPINRDCLVPEGEAVLPLGAGSSAHGTVPADACRLFGPEPAPAKDGEPAGRPVDPDPTGGFYVPGRVYDPDSQRYAIFETRLQCDLAGVTQAVFADFNQRYQPNENPAVEGLRAGKRELEPASAAAAALSVKPGEKLELRARWADCEDGADACSGAEFYLYFDRATRKLATRREGMRVSWFATAGEFRDARTGRAEAEADEGASDNVWTAPKSTGDVKLWVVLRDDRGGTAWKRFDLLVER